VKPVIVLAILAVACDSKDRTSTTPGGDDTSEIPVANCDVPLDGVDWGSSPVSDAEPGIEDVIAAFDPASLPEAIDIAFPDFSAMYRGQIAYALEIPLDELGDTLDRDAAYASGPMGAVVLASLTVGEDGTEMDFALYRQGLLRYYTCSKEYPLTLDGFEATFGSVPEDYTDVTSMAKCGTRRLRTDHERGLYVAQTFIDGEVREHEILMQSTREDGQLDFVVYDADGLLTDRSQFPTISGGNHIVTAAPYVCMSCHFNATAHESSWGYDILLPSSGPCAR